VPPVYNWRTTDDDEINRRRQRALEESFQVTNLDRSEPVFSTFRVRSASGLDYQVEIRGLEPRRSGCTCVDFRINGLGTCKHVEAVLLQLQRRHARAYAAGRRNGSKRLEIVPDRATGSLRLESPETRLPAALARWFTTDGRLKRNDADEALEALKRVAATSVPQLRISQEVQPWMEARRRGEQRKALRHEYELKVQQGQWPANETRVPLFPYQREGMLHLAFTERALLADEMGLGKTIQAIAACALLHRLGQVRRVLVVTPASLKTEWEEQIQRFTDLHYRLVYGGRRRRLEAYDAPAFFTLTNYEQMVSDSLEVNARLQPDVVILDEAQRIKNWNTKTAQAVKRLRSRYAFVLTGTPIENRIDELHSLMDFLDPSVLGPLFRFNRDFYTLDERGRPVGYRQLDQLHARVKPYLLRRRKAEVETELPRRTDRNHFVPMSEAQQASYAEHSLRATRLLRAAMRRPLKKSEQEWLQRELAMMRMICDTNYILDPEDRSCPKLSELEKILEECRDNDAKVIVFSEWERMLELVRSLCEQLGMGYAWHTGSVPQQRRRTEINAFKTDSHCRVFLSTDSGATGLNLQNASTVINCDLPWNPAKLEQRIARAWRKHQTQPVTVVNLISEDTLEHRMLDTLATKQTVADSVLDRPGSITEISIGGSRQAFLARLQQLLTPSTTTPPATTETGPRRPADPALAFAEAARERINGALIRCEERYPQDELRSVILLVVENDVPSRRPALESLYRDHFPPHSMGQDEPPQLEVIDRATDEALQRLMKAGLIAKSDRAARPLVGVDPATPPVLSAEEEARLTSLRTQIDRKLKMARLLADGDLHDEARASLAEATLFTARLLAAKHRLPEPATVDEALRPPLSLHWQDGAGPLLRFLSDATAPASDWRRTLQAHLP